jgi:hydrogen peroxide-dependent heme synthase
VSGIEPDADTIYAYYPVFRPRPGLLGEPPGGGEVDDAEILLKEWADRVTVRGVYSTTGFRSDADLMMWWVAREPDTLQDLLSVFRRSSFGRHLQLVWAFMGLVRPAEFSPDHAPAFVKGEPPRRYLCVYPFVRTPEWYLLPPEQRSELLREHGEIGRAFPEVLANTTSAFGLSDWEWILAFESDRLDRIVACIRELRAAEARRYTKVEVPFVTGIRKELSEAAVALF